MGDHLHGGARAARLLEAAITLHLSSVRPDLRQYKVIAHVYTKVENIVPHVANGFSREQPLLISLLV